MRKTISLCLTALVGIAVFFGTQSFASEVNAEGDSLCISGIILDSHQEPVAGAMVKVIVNGRQEKVLVEHRLADGAATSAHGTYRLEFRLPQRQIDTADIYLQISKASFSTSKVELRKEDLAQRGERFLAVKDIEMSRVLGPAFYMATAVFLLAYIAISFEFLHRTVASLLGASILLLMTYTLGTINPEYHILSFERAVHAVDMNVIFLLIGMMVIVGVLRHTGIFQWCAYISFRLARGNIMALAIISMIFIAVSSAFLDNVTTMLLYTPVLIEIALALKISPYTLLLPGIMASNVGGTATLIGDPPNIMIGSHTGFTFMEFVINLTPVCIISMAVLFVYNKLFYGKLYSKDRVKDIDRLTASLKDECKIKDKTFLGYGLFVIALVISLFITHGYWHMEVSIPALFGAGILFSYGILTGKVKMLELVEKDIEWTTLLFFIFLFILVGAVEEVGLLSLIADWVVKLSHGSLVAAVCLILWVAAIMSAFVDNIPFTATMLPITTYLTKVIPGAESNMLWWALALGP